MRLALLFGVLLSASACDVGTSLGSDFGVVLPGCYGPNACWRIKCACNFNTIAADCMVCDPASVTGNICDCTADGATDIQCLEQAQVCVGTAPQACDGTCIHNIGKSCIDPTVDHVPPDEVASRVGDGGQPGTEKHCPYFDDICCD